MSEYRLHQLDYRVEYVGGPRDGDEFGPGAFVLHQRIPDVGGEYEVESREGRIGFYWLPDDDGIEPWQRT